MSSIKKRWLRGRQDKVGQLACAAWSQTESKVFWREYVDFKTKKGLGIDWGRESGAQLGDADVSPQLLAARFLEVRCLNVVGGFGFLELRKV